MNETRSADPYRAVAPGILLRHGVGPIVPETLGLVLDIDGVLIDTHASYVATVLAAIDWHCRTKLERIPPALGPSEVAAWKAAGGFNDDWHLAEGICLYLTWAGAAGRWPVEPAACADFAAEVAHRGGGLAGVRAVCGTPGSGLWDPGTITRICMERYGGAEAPVMFGIDAPAGVEGLWRRERQLVPAEALEPWRGRLAVFTGRNDGETVLGLQAAGLEDFFPHDRRWTATSGQAKPDPAGLAYLFGALGMPALLYVGDTPDDAEAARRLQAAQPPCAVTFAGVLGGAPGARAEGIFRARQVELIASDAGRLLAFLSEWHLGT